MKVKNSLKLMCLALCIVICFCACKSGAYDTNSGSDTSNTESSVKKLELLYSANDSLNPYQATTKINAEATLLMFDPLIKLNSSFEPVLVLASEVGQVKDKTLTVKLKSAQFTDGSSLSADDVVFSFNLAKNSATKYAYQLKSVVACSAINSGEVAFTLSKNDPYAANLLDFPILKSGSDNLTDEDNVALPPIGCGRYSFNLADERLEVNKNYHGDIPNIDYISLINSPDEEAVNHNISVGTADVYYTDLSDENIVRMSGKRVGVNLNNLVYLGTNNREGHILNDVHLRYAVSAAISREEIAEQAYYKNANPATGIFNPVFSDSAQYQTLQKTANREIVVVNLEEIGYNSFDDNGFAVNSKGKRINLSILVNEESTYKKLAADLIAKQLCSAGIQAEVTAVPYAEYLARLNRAEFDLYLAETAILNNMDITELVIDGGSVAFGIAKIAQRVSGEQQNKPDDNGNVLSESASDNNADSEPQNNIGCEEILNSFYNGECNIGSVATIFESQLPLIPVVYRIGVFFYSNEIETVPNPSVSDIFFKIEDFSLSN